MINSEDRIAACNSLLNTIHELIHEYWFKLNKKPSYVYVGIEEYRTLISSYELLPVTEDRLLGKEEIEGIPLIRISRDHHIAIGYDHV